MEYHSLSIAVCRRPRLSAYAYASMPVADVAVPSFDVTQLHLPPCRPLVMPPELWQASSEGVAGESGVTMALLHLLSTSLPARPPTARTALFRMLCA